MKKTITLFTILLTTIAVNSQKIYSKFYGNPKDKPVIYLHGGPGYNAVGFEYTTAQELSKNGYYVIVYDRRGEGRSPDKNATFTFQETFKDLTEIYTKFNLKTATLIGHSFGGIVATLYAEKNPKKVNSVVLVGAPLAMQDVFSTIIKTSKLIYTNKKDSVNLKYIAMIENMDKASIEYSSYCFAHAMQNGFYSPKNPTKEALDIYKKFGTDSVLMKYASLMTYEPPKGFWKNENYTSIDLTLHLQKVQEKGIPLFGLYGKEDGLYSVEHINKLEKIIEKNNFEYLEACSHNVFIDQQNQFINAIKIWIK